MEIEMKTQLLMILVAPVVLVYVGAVLEGLSRDNDGRQGPGRTVPREEAPWGCRPGSPRCGDGQFRSRPVGPCEEPAQTT